MENVSIICKLCNKSVSKYTCPRCNVRYCSAECYKSEEHMQCSELFYRNCFITGLQGMEADSEERKKVMEMLQRLEQSEGPEESEDDEEEDLCNRIGGINVDRHPEKIWRLLKKHEQKEFVEMIESGETSKLVEIWNPWWCEKLPVHLEISEDNPVLQRVPTVWKGAKELSKLQGSKHLSDTICFDILNVLYGFAYISRLYNGDFSDLNEECAQGMLALSQALKNCQFDDISSTICSCLMRLSVGEEGESFYVSKEFSVAIIEDVVKIAKGPNTFRPALYVSSALSECREIFRRAKKDFDKAAKKSVGAPDQLKRDYFLAQKKLEFYLGWVENNSNVFNELVAQIEIEFCNQSTELIQQNNECDQMRGYLNENKFRHGKKLIEEL